MNLKDIQLQIERVKMEEQQQERKLAFSNPWTLKELDRLHCFQAKMKHELFMERDLREFKRLVKKYHNFKMSDNMVSKYAMKLAGAC